jgi:hypothetical protein
MLYRTSFEKRAPFVAHGMSGVLDSDPRAISDQVVDVGVAGLDDMLDNRLDGVAVLVRAIGFPSLQVRLLPQGTHKLSQINSKAILGVAEVVPYRRASAAGKPGGEPQ